MLRIRRSVVVAVGGVVALAAGTALALAASSNDRPEGRAGTGVPLATVAVERRDLIEQETFDGTLRYSNSRTVANQLVGTITSMAREGAKLSRGDALWEVDERPVSLLYGATPAYRTLELGVPDGDDIRQLERNLVALGHDTYDSVTVDRHFDWATVRAIKRWETELAVERDGVIDFGEVVFQPGPVRVGAHKTTVGTLVGRGSQVTDVSSTTRIVTFDVEVDQVSLVAKGTSVEVEMPAGNTVKGAITHIGEVATPHEGGEASIEVIVSPASDKGARNLAQAPVDVKVSTDVAKDALSVPVAALLALAEGGYAVEVDDGRRRRLVAVDTGMYADGWVQISGHGLTEDTRVVIPR